jgi:hypothetical protein
MTEDDSKVLRRSADNRMMTVPDINLVAPEPPVAIMQDPLSEEIARAIEMMKRVRTVSAAQSQGQTEGGNIYILPPPLFFQAS